MVKTSKALIIARRSEHLTWSDVGPCGAQLWTAVLDVVILWDPSSALVPLDMKHNWVDKSSILLYEELPHLLSLRGSCLKKVWKMCAHLGYSSQTFCLQFFFWQCGEIFFPRLMLMQRNLRISLFSFVLGLICDHLFSPSWKITRNRSSEQWCLLLTF